MNSTAKARHNSRSTPTKPVSVPKKRTVRCTMHKKCWRSSKVSILNIFNKTSFVFKNSVWTRHPFYSRRRRHFHILIMLWSLSFLACLDCSSTVFPPMRRQNCARDYIPIHWRSEGLLISSVHLFFVPGITFLPLFSPSVLYRIWISDFLEKKVFSNLNDHSVENGVERMHDKMMVDFIKIWIANFLSTQQSAIGG